MNKFHTLKDLTDMLLDLSKKENIIQKGLCINCGEPALPKCYSEEGRREFEISGMCEKCFDEMFKDEGRG